jgi:glycyl-tRNA synthetase (class II)
MFGTKLGASADAMDLYLRPETAQGFCKLLKCAKSGRMKVPLDSSNRESI